MATNISPSQIKLLYEDGWSTYKIAERFEKNSSTIRGMLIRAGTNFRTRREASSRLIRFDEDTRNDILFRHQILLQSPNEIGRIYQVSGTKIRRVLTENGWYRDLRKIPAYFLRRTGEKHWNWKGGKTGWRWTMEHRAAFPKFRNNVFKRDGWKCKFCGSSLDMQLHHILPVRDFPEKYYDEDNAITLCSNCHDETKGREYDYVERCREAIA